MSQREEEYENPSLDRVEAGFRAKMESDRAKKERHRHGHGEKQKPRVQAIEDDSKDQTAHNSRSARRMKKQKRKSSDLSLAKEMVEGRNPQSFGKTVTRKSLVGIEAIEDQQKGIRAKHDDDDGEAGAKVSKKRKRNPEYLTSSKHLGTLLVESEQNPAFNKITKNADEEGIRKKEEKLRRRNKKTTNRKRLEGTKDSVGGDREVVNNLETVVDISPKKRNKLDGRVSQEDRQLASHTLDPSDRSTLTKDTQKPTPDKKKRKLDQSPRTPLLQLKSVPVHDAKPLLTPIIKACPQATLKIFEENNSEHSTNNKKNDYKLNQSPQRSPLLLHAVPAYQPPQSSRQSVVDIEGIGSDRVPEKEKQKFEKNAKKRFLVPSHLLVPAARANGALLQSVIKGCGSHISSTNPGSEEASKASNTSNNSTSSYNSNADEKEELPGNGSVFRPPQPTGSMSSSSSSTHPMKKVANETKTEAAILPRKIPAQTATRTPIVVTKLIRPKKVKAKSTAHKDSEDKACSAQTRKASLRAPMSANASEEDESFSQTIASIKKATSTKMQDLFSDIDHGVEKEELISLVVDSLQKSSSKLQSLFSPGVDSASTSFMGTKGDIRAIPSNTSVKPARASSVAAGLGQFLVSNEESVSGVSDEWEAGVGKVRGSAQADDTEAQENIAFSSTYIASRATGIKIANTTFQAHNLRHAEGWVASCLQETTGRESRNVGSAFKLKLCTVISGRVHVLLGKNAFGIGKGGLFRVRSGEECVVRNEEKNVAVLWVVCVE